jgi:N-acetylmuramic acid 6-phosphate etherase
MTMTHHPSSQVQGHHDLTMLVSEGRNPRSINIDLLPTRDILGIINDEDQIVPRAVTAVLDDVARAVDAIIHSFRDGGRLIYVGAGTSGRLGVLDAAECPPTFGVPEGMVIGIIAGGQAALTSSIEGAEDNEDAARADLGAVGVSATDVVVGIAASGRTPYVQSALIYAKALGVTTVALSCNPGSAIAHIADIAISPVVGPEVLTGSTRMKSGTAEKLVLNMLTTASMIGIGKTYQNLMVDMAAKNQKLVTRAVTMVREVTQCSVEDAQAALAATQNNVKLAILMVITGLDSETCLGLLHRSDGFLRRAIAAHAPTKISETTSSG